MANAETSHERIGEFLVKIGAMTAGQREDVMTRQAKEPDRLFGEIAIELGHIDDAAVDRFLDQKGR